MALFGEAYVHLWTVTDTVTTAVMMMTNLEQFWKILVTEK